METARKTMTVEEAGRLLGIGRNTAYEAARLGQIPVIRIGKRLVVPAAALDRMLDGQRDHTAVPTKQTRRVRKSA